MIIRILTILLIVLPMNLVCAAPINSLEQGQSALGILVEGGTDSYYAETQVSQAVTLGCQYTKWSDDTDMTDFYAQLQADANSELPVRVLVGSKSYESENRGYIGLAVSVPLSEEVTGYASAAVGSGFQEIQAGANYDLSETAALNLNYHAFHCSGTKSGVGVGVTCRF